MAPENDQPEAIAEGQVEDVPDAANEAARRRVMEFKEEILACEHAGDIRIADALDRSARALEQWETSKDPKVREKLLEQVGREMMTIHEAPPAPINSKEMLPYKLGGYIDEDFQTNLNKALLERDDPRDALETYLHEYRHAEQSYEVQKSHGFAARGVDLERATAVESSSGDRYIRPDVDPTGYQRQFVEVDAERFGTATADEILERRDVLRASAASESPVAVDANAAASWRLAEVHRKPE
jgi:hypothetical protein